MKAWSAALAAVAVLTALSGAVAQVEEPLITLDLKDADLITAVRALMSESGKSYVLGPDVPADLRVTMHVADVRFEDALRQMLVPLGLSYTVQSGGIYLIQKKTETRTRVDTGIVEGSSEPVEISEGVTVQKIKLMHTDPYEIWAVLTGNGSGNRFDVPGLTGLWPYAYDNSLIARFGGAPNWGGLGQTPGTGPQTGTGPGIQGGWPSAGYGSGQGLDPRYFGGSRGGYGGYGGGRGGFGG
jgi:hypothetical protein